MSDGKIHVDVGDDPVYIEHSKKTYGPLAAGGAPTRPSGNPTTAGAGSPPSTSTTASVSPQSNPTSGSPVVNTQTTSPNPSGNPASPVRARRPAARSSRQWGRIGGMDGPNADGALTVSQRLGGDERSGIPFNVLILNGPDGVQFM